MLFRPRRHSLSSYHSKSGDDYGRLRWERPSSAPSVRSGSNCSVARVEQRLCIVKRNRVNQTPEESRTTSNVSPSSSPKAVLPETANPPCAAYPTFDLSHLPSHEQQLVEGLVAEITDAIVFPSAR